MRIYKEHVLKALRLEPLKRGSWMDLEDPNDISNSVFIFSCEACIAGAVLRRFTNFSPQTIAEICSELINKEPGKLHPKESRHRLPITWFGKITYKWESFNTPIRKARTQMVKWVEENVPENEVLWETD